MQPPENPPAETKLLSIDEAPESIADKLLKMVALAQGSTEGEAANALAKAKQFAMRHQIDFLTINMEEAGSTKSLGLSREPFVSERYKTAAGEGRRPPSHNYISWILENHFRVKIVFFTRPARLRSTIEIVGRKSDVAFAIYVYGYLRTTFNRLWCIHKAATGADTNRRNGYFYGLYKGLDAKLKDASSKEEMEKLLLAHGADAPGGSDGKPLVSPESWQLAVTEETDLLDRAQKDFHPVLKRSKSSGPPIEDWNDVTAGQADGRSIEIAIALRPGDDSDNVGEEVEETPAPQLA